MSNVSFWQRQHVIAAKIRQLFHFSKIETWLLGYKIKLFIFLTVKRCCYKETANSSFSNVNMLLLERNVNCFMFLTSKRCYWEHTSNVSCSYVKSLLLNFLRQNVVWKKRQTVHSSNVKTLLLGRNVKALLPDATVFILLTRCCSELLSNANTNVPLFLNRCIVQT